RSFQSDPADAGGQLAESEEAKKLVEEISAERNTQNNLLTDVFYVDKGSSKLCRVGIITSRALLEKMPDRKTEEIKLDEIPDAEVVRLDKEKSMRKIAKLSIEADFESSKELLEEALKKKGIAEGEPIGLKELEVLNQALPGYFLGEGLIVRHDVKTCESDASEVKLSFEVRRISKGVVLRKAPEDTKRKDFGEVTISDGDMNVLEREINRMAKGDAKSIGRMLMGHNNLQYALKDSEAARNLPFTPVVQEYHTEEGKTTLYIYGIELPTIPVLWSNRPEDETKGDARRMTAEVGRKVKNAKNQAELNYWLSHFRKKALEGWDGPMDAREELFYYSIPREDGRPVIILASKPIQTSVEVEGDLPDEIRGPIRKRMMDALSRHPEGNDEPSIAKLEKAALEIYAKIRDAGYFIDEGSIKIIPGTDGKAIYRISLLRWNGNELNILGETMSPAEKEKARKAASEVMEEYAGRFVTAKDAASIERKLARALMLSEIRLDTVSCEELVDDGNGGKKKVVKSKTILMAEKGIKYINYGGGLGASSESLFASGFFSLMDDGRGRSIGAAYTGMFKWGLAGDGKLANVPLQSLRINYGQPIGANESISASLYGMFRSLDEAYMAIIGGEFSHRTYLIDDSLILSTIGGIEYIKAPDGVKGFERIPLRLKPGEAISYNRGGLSLDGYLGFTVGATNYVDSNLRLHYTIPLGKDGKPSTPRISIRVNGGIRAGKMPEMEMINQMDVGLPGSNSLLDLSDETALGYLGATIAFGWDLNKLFSFDPLSTSLILFGNSAWVTAGTCIGLGPLEVCGGWQQGIWNAESDRFISISPRKIELQGAAKVPFEAMVTKKFD
ncbi:MAG TPA: hypothetical protein PLZ86_02715, partial [bacterium]|nr:hypothetical protein [bacterium]